MEVMHISTFHYGSYGYVFSNGPVVHTKDGFESEAAARSAGRQDRALTRAYAHRFEPRILSHRDESGDLVIEGWTYKCACGERRGTGTLIQDDHGPCGAAEAVC